MKHQMRCKSAICQSLWLWPTGCDGNNFSTSSISKWRDLLLISIFMSQSKVKFRNSSFLPLRIWRLWRRMPTKLNLENLKNISIVPSSHMYLIWSIMTEGVLFVSNSWKASFLKGKLSSIAKDVPFLILNPYHGKLKLRIWWSQLIGKTFIRWRKASSKTTHPSPTSPYWKRTKSKHSKTV